MRSVRAAVAVMAVVLVGAAVPPAGALEDPPVGDDGRRYFYDIQDPVCGDPDISGGGERIRYREMPASGATFHLRYVVGDVVVGEDGPFAVGVQGTGTLNYPGQSYGAYGYPVRFGVLARVEVDGETTYIGGTILECASAGATPTVTEYQDFSPPCGLEGDPAFPDVPASNQFCEDVAWARDWGITMGYPGGGFHPTDPVTRQAMAAFLYRSAGRPAVPICAGGPFPDVPGSHPFCEEIDWLVDQGITTGYEDGTFRPAADVSRQAMAAFLYRSAGEPRGGDPACSAAAFPDVASSHPFCGEIDWLRDVGITAGYSDGTYRPDANVSRQAMAAFLHRLDALP